MKKNDGFTLVELLASITLLGLLLTAFIQSFVFSQQAAVTNKDKLMAINVAQMELEQIKKDTSLNTSDKTYDKEVDGIKYKISVSFGEKVLDTSADTSGPKLYPVTVNVSKGKTHAEVTGVVEI